MTHTTAAVQLAAADQRELIDALTEAVDLGRTWEVARLRDLLDRLGLAQAFDDEIRLNGSWSECCGDCWIEVAA